MSTRTARREEAAREKASRGKTPRDKARRGTGPRDDRTAQGLVRGRALDAVMVLVLLAIAAVPLWPVYQHPAVLVLAGVALALGAAIAFLGAWMRWPGYAVVALTVLAYVVVGVPLAVPTKTYATVLPTLDGLRELVVGTVTAWRQMLTSQVPFGTYQALLVPALVVVLGCAVVGTTVALRARHAGWAVLAPAAVLTFGIAFGSDDAVWPVACGLALFVVALSWATVRTDRLQAPSALAGVTRKVSASTVRRYVAATVLVAVCGAGASGIVGLVPPTEDRHVLRDAVTPPFDLRDLVSPLIGFRNQVLPPGSDTALLAVDGLPEGARVRVATLDAYTGMVFAVGTDASSGTFERVPYRIERPDARGRRASVTFTVEGYDDLWVPTVGDLTTIAFPGDAGLADSFYYNTATGSAVLLGRLRSGTVYTLDVVVPDQPSLEELASALPGDARQAESDEIPQDLVDAAHLHGTGDTPGARLVALTRWLRTGYVSHSGEDEPFSRPGHSAERLRLLLTEDPMLGDAEQYATAMALLAREVGFPSRVVVGYAPAADQTVLVGADTTAWVEVQLADGRWVTVDPNPEARDVPTDDTPASDPVAHPQTVLPPPPPSDDEVVSAQSNDDESPSDDPAEDHWLAVLLAVLRVAGPALGVLALLTSPLWVLALAAAVRRSRRRRRDRRRGVVTGAWDEVRDAMVDRGYEIHPAATRAEIAALADSDIVRSLAERADRAVFDREGPRPADVVGYWREVKPARRSLDAGTTRWGRVRRVLSLRTARSLRGSLRGSLATWRRRRREGTP